MHNYSEWGELHLEGMLLWQGKLLCIQYSMHELCGPSVDGFTEVKRRGRKRHTHTQSSRAPAATERELKENEYSGPETRLLMLKTETVR